MRPRCKPEIVDFVRQIAPGRSSKEIAEIANERFGDNFTQKTMASFMKNHHIRNGLRDRNAKATNTEKYPRHVREYIYANYVGIGPKKMAQILNEKFGTAYTRINIKAFYANNGLSSGLKGSEGCSPPNKGKKGLILPGCEKTWFPTGNVPHNWLPLGTISQKSDGYLWKKIKDDPKAGRANWRQLHILVWEEANGPLPKGARLAFLDGNPENCALENIVLTDPAEIAAANGLHLRFSDPELTKAGLMVAKVTIAAKRRLNKYQGGNECSKISK